MSATPASLEKAAEAASRCCGAGASAGVVDSGIPPTHHRNLGASTYTYSGEALRAVELPFGAVGGGCVSLAGIVVCRCMALDVGVIGEGRGEVRRDCCCRVCVPSVPTGDGGLRQWQLGNQINHTGQIPDSFFAVRTVQSDGTSKAAVLMSSALYNSAGFTPAPMISDADVPVESVKLLATLPGVDTLQVEHEHLLSLVVRSFVRLLYCGQDPIGCVSAWCRRLPPSSPSRKWTT